MTATPTPAPLEGLADFLREEADDGNLHGAIQRATMLRWATEVEALRSAAGGDGADRPLPQAALDFDQFLNEPPEYEDKYMVREYRHQAYRRWEKALAALRSAAPPAPAVQGWQAIETAPRAGLIDLWWCNRRYIDCYWDSICKEYRCIDTSGRLIIVKSPSHWMQTPAAPLATDEAQGGQP